MGCNLDQYPCMGKQLENKANDFGVTQCRAMDIDYVEASLEFLTCGMPFCTCVINALPRDREGCVEDCIEEAALPKRCASTNGH